jgi:hypothetical protein
VRVSVLRDHVETMSVVVPSIFKFIRNDAALAKMFPTIDVSCGGNAARR